MLGKLKNKTETDHLLKYRYFNSIDDVPNDDWQKVLNDSVLFLTIAYLKALEKTLYTTMDFKYIVFYKGSVPVGIASTQIIKVKTASINLDEFPCKINDTIKKAVMKNLDVKVLVCGNLFSCGEHGFCFTPKFSMATAMDFLSEALLELRKKDAADKPSFVLIKEFWQESEDQRATLESQKFRKLHIDYNMVLDMHPGWDTFDKYLAMMKTKFRTRAKKVDKNSETLVAQELDVNGIMKYLDEIDVLYDSVLDNADFKIGRLKANTFLQLKLNLGDAYLFKAYFLNKNMVGFSTAFVTSNTLEANHIGINYKYNKTHDVYQRMLYDFVRKAITLKVSQLHLGRTAETIKTGVGALPVAMSLYVRHGNTISNTLLKPLIDMISPSDFEVRNPFKNIPQT